MGKSKELSYSPLRLVKGGKERKEKGKYKKEKKKKKKIKKKKKKI